MQDVASHSRPLRVPRRHWTEKMTGRGIGVTLAYVALLGEPGRPDQSCACSALWFGAAAKVEWVEPFLQVSLQEEPRI